MSVIEMYCIFEYPNSNSPVVNNTNIRILLSVFDATIPIIKRFVLSENLNK
jgi:hypothetical protein